MWNTFETVKKKLEPEIVKAVTVKEIIKTSAKKFKDKTYLIYAPTGESLTFKEFNSLCNTLAQGLLSLPIGLEKGDRVALFLRNSPIYLASIYACAKAGLVETPVNWFYKEMEVKYIVGNSEAKVVICEADLLPILLSIRKDLPNLKKIIVSGGEPQAKEDKWGEVITLDEVIGMGKDKEPQVKVTQDNTMAIIYTSGTTGMPKGAVLTHKAYTLSAKAIALWPIEEMERNYNPLPLFHINAQIYSSLNMMLAGKTYIMGDKFSPTKFMDDVIKFEATSFNVLGSIMQVIYTACSQNPKYTKNPAKFVIVGGTPRELWEKFEETFDVQILEGYSQTEEPLPFVNHPDRDRRKIGSFGLPAFPDLEHKVKVVDENGNEVKTGTPGELIRKSPCTMKGYFRDEEKTKEAFIDGYLRTGDIVVRDEDGFTFFVDRKKFIIRRSGENISAWEVEAVIKDHPKVEDCAVIPVPDAMKGEEIKAIVKLKQGETITEEEIIFYVGKRLAHFKTPRYVEILPNLPYTPTGRVKKAELIEEERKRENHGFDRDAMIPNWKEKLK